jgi:hypothetical protein
MNNKIIKKIKKNKKSKGTISMMTEYYAKKLSPRLKAKPWEK